MTRGTGEHPAQKRRWVRRGVGILVGVLLTVTAVWVVYGGGRHQGPGTITAGHVDDDRAERQRAAAGPGGGAEEQILFGDLHVHTTFSADAFMRSLPLMAGEGVHPPADACDFARFCSRLDFFALTDHAEGLTARHWAETKESVRQCNAAAGELDDPDLVAFTGFEWTQVGRIPEEHYGHRNVIFRHDDEARLPTRPIAANGIAGRSLRAGLASGWTQAMIPLWEFSERQAYLDIGRYLRDNAALEDCPAGVDVHDLPLDCRELAGDPPELFAKLDQWGFDTLVIPHGTTWGFYTPPGYTWDKQLAPAMDTDRQRLLEVFSGHGNSEEYRPFRSTVFDDDGTPRCPEETPVFEPCCVRAGKIIAERCIAGGGERDECEHRAAVARQRYVDAGIAGHLAIPGATVEDWGTCGQCEDCFDPSFNYRPGGAAQYILARGHFDEGAEVRHARFGFIASSDNHSARPGTGYKDYARRRMTEATGFRSEKWRDRLFGRPEAPLAVSRELDMEEVLSQPAFRTVELERQASFFLTGGLVAVHSRGRDRESIWEALWARRVYGTSGDRILLWFALDGDPPTPMGGEALRGGRPRFTVRAAGAFEQLAGCPESVQAILGTERLEQVCGGECYRPGDERRRIERIEIIRIRLQRSPTEDVGALIEDPWRTIHCPPNAEVCEGSIEDEDFGPEAGEVAYYARAIQEPTRAINAGGLRCDEGECSPCYGDYRTDFSDDCLAPNRERAWSSPIWVRYDPSAPAGPEPGTDAGAEAEAGTDDD